jgi:hypothetical protein
MNDFIIFATPLLKIAMPAVTRMEAQRLQAQRQSRMALCYPFDIRSKEIRHAQPAVAVQESASFSATLIEQTYPF